MIDMILPCCGKSSRFPDKPKWMLTQPSGNLMIQECLTGLDLKNISTIYITFCKKHVEMFEDKNLENLFEWTKKNIVITVLDDFTFCQAETVYTTLIKNNIKNPVYIKDCDNNFSFLIEKGNYVNIINVNGKNNINNLYNKSFVIKNEKDIITNIIEKKIISNDIIVGGYSFENIEEFKNSYEYIKNKNKNKGEIYISNIIFYMILNKDIFYSKYVTNYSDWGTYEDWINYRNQFRTYFIDLDGVLLMNGSEHFIPLWKDTIPIQKNIEVIKKLYENKKTQIILTTSRKSKYEEETKKILKNYNIPYDKIIFDLYHSKRYLINDFKNKDYFPASTSINIKRNSNNLSDFIIL